MATYICELREIVIKVSGNTAGAVDPMAYKHVARIIETVEDIKDVQLNKIDLEVQELPGSIQPVIYELKLLKTDSDYQAYVASLKELLLQGQAVPF